MFFWVNIQFSLPRLYTSILGSPAQLTDISQKRYSYSRRSCDYSLSFRKMDRFNFKFCISKKRFESLPDGDHRVEILTTQSSLGDIANRVSYLEKYP